jgi:glycosyltransferase involved in cell wall biosynthesis
LVLFFKKEHSSFFDCAPVLRLLTFSTLYPNPAQPNHGVFVENRLRHLVATGCAQATVLAPVAWFPGRRLPAAPREETRHGIRVLHPRWLSIPAIGMRPAPWLLYMAAMRALGRLIEAGGHFDAIDAHYLYPDGVAAIWLGRRFGLQVVLTARGSDVTQFPDYPFARRLILDAVRQAAAVITVSAGLRDALTALGARTDKITVLRNGVDTSVFRPLSQTEARRALGLDAATSPRRIMVSVGALIARKGHDRTIACLAELPDWQLLIAGEGPERARLEALATRLGVAPRVRLLGSVPHHALATLYSAADISVLASSREGWANVLLESMACGTPVIASPIPGNPEVVGSRAAGLIAGENTPAGIADAVRRWWAEKLDRHATRAYAEQFSWDATTEGQLNIFRAITAGIPKGEASLPP